MSATERNEISAGGLTSNHIFNLHRIIRYKISFQNRLVLVDIQKRQLSFQKTFKSLISFGKDPPKRHVCILFF